MNTTNVDFWKELKHSRDKLTPQKYRAIKGQAVKGHIEDARRGLRRVVNRRCGR